MPIKQVRVQQAIRLARARLPLIDKVELRQRRQIVRTKSEWLRHALVGIRATNDIDRMHHRPKHRLVEGRLRGVREDVVIGLRPAQPKHTAERPHQLILQLHLLLRRRAGAAAIKNQNRMLNETSRHDRINALRHAILQASRRIARPVAQ
jgi:hypothetical protein